MKSKKELLAQSRLYVIVDRKVISASSLIKVTRKLRDSSVDLIQLRDKESPRSEILKNALKVKKIISVSNCLFIMNDYIDVARIAGCDGVHIGQKDISLSTARKILGKDRLIGVSCSNLREALIAQSQGADYLGIGPVFRTGTKHFTKKPIGLKVVDNLKKYIRIPFFLIGGINTSTVKEVVAGNFKRVAICSAIVKAKHIPIQVNYFQKQLSIP